jgi:hypothetical protein
MTTRAVLLSCGLSLSIGVVGFPRLASGEERPSEPAASVDLSGRWVYDARLSDDAREKMRQGREQPGGHPGGGGPMGPGGGGMGGPGGGRMGPPPGTDGDDARESMRAVFEPAEELAIAQSGTEIVIEERFGRTRRLHPDGKKYKTDNGASEIKTAWKEGKLRVETKRTRGGGVVETWELVPDASRLIVSVKIEPGFAPAVELKRIYDRAPRDAAN